MVAWAVSVFESIAQQALASRVEFGGREYASMVAWAVSVFESIAQQAFCLTATELNLFLQSPPV